MADNTEIKNFINENSYLFWWVKPEARENISISALVEGVLSYGDEKSVKKLFDLVGVKKVAEIFYRQTSGPRSNYHYRTQNFFELYFKRHVH
jgi:hypothetical protein